LVPYFYPLPRIDDLHDKLKGKTCFVCLDLSQSYHQVLVAEEDRHKLAFTVDGEHWQFKNAPMGINTISGLFQALVNSVLSGEADNATLKYQDDICVTGVDDEDLLRNLELVFMRHSRILF